MLNAYRGKFFHQMYSHLQCLAKKLDFLGFSIQNDPRCYGRKPLKSYVKSTNFFSNACINVGGLSMSFGSKIFNGFWVTSLQIWKYQKKSVLVRKNEY